jgi:AcrR family transcriptional regulator
MTADSGSVLPRRGRAVNTYRMTSSRSLLLAAAAEEFARHGREGARIQAVVQRAGVNERMIYHHFGNKDGLYAAVLRELQIELADAWLTSLSDLAKLDPYSGMRTALAGFYDAITARPLLPALWMHEALAGWHTMPLPTADMIPNQVRELYQRGQRDGVFRADCPFELAYAIAIGALIALPAFAPRFAGILPSRDEPAAAGTKLRDQVIGQLLDGITGPNASTITEASPP